MSRQMDVDSDCEDSQKENNKNKNSNKVDEFVQTETIPTDQNLQTDRPLCDQLNNDPVLKNPPRALKRGKIVTKKKFDCFGLL